MGRNSELFNEANIYIPGGVNSPARAFNAVGGQPVFIKKAKGAILTDVEGKDYIDYIGSWGPMILGHAHPEIVETVCKVAEKSTSFGAPNEFEVLLAKKVCRLTQNDKVRFVNSGTEATMTAIRLARGITQRSKIIKFEGCYHGHADSFLIKAGSAATTLGEPDSSGLPAEVVQNTLIAPYNDLHSVASLFKNYGHQIAAIIIEPVAGNMGCILPEPGFLEGLRELCNQHQSLLIFDEVITGFRLSLNGARDLVNVSPDLTTYGKIIGGGLPVGALAGKAEYMDYLAPLGPVFQAGTLSGNPLAMAAGLKTLELLEKINPYKKLEKYNLELGEYLLDIFAGNGIPVQLNQTGSLFTLFFNKNTVRNYSDACTTNQQQFKTFFTSLFRQGIYPPPSTFECWFISTAHTHKHLEQTVVAVQKAVKEMI